MGKTKKNPEPSTQAPVHQTVNLQTVVADLADRMNELGGSPAEVVVALTAENIVGERNDDHCCPIANYLKKKTRLPKQSYISVQHKVVNVLEHMAGDILCSVPIPKGVEKFIEAWDSGKYKKLADVSQ